MNNYLKLKINKYIGDKAFYKVVFSVALPILIQTAITNFVNLLDNVMVGRIGTEQMSGVAISNQLIVIFNLALFGAVSGVGIFTAQYFGNKDYEGMKRTMRFDFYTCTLLVACSCLVLALFAEPLIKLFLHTSAYEGSLEATLQYGKEYLYIILIGLPAYTISQIYSSVLRSAKKTMAPMVSGCIAVFVNLLLNYILIYGSFGAPALGVRGAAIATVASRYVELVIILLWSHLNKGKTPFFKGIFKSFKVPLSNVKVFFIKGSPLFVNEFLWSVGVSFLIQCYSIRGLNVIAAFNIYSTLMNLFNAGIIAMGNSVGIIIGNMLGAGDIKGAKEADVKLIVFSILFCVVLGGLFAITGTFMPKAYNTTTDVQQLATALIYVAACTMPLHAFLNAAYFTMRAGGKTIITFFFDSVFVWVVCVPVAASISRLTDMDIIPMFIIVSALDIIKAVVGYILLKNGVWCKNIIGVDTVSNSAEAPMCTDNGENIELVHNKSAD